MKFFKLIGFGMPFLQMKPLIRWSYLMAAVGLQSLWSLSLAFIDIYALMVKRRMRNSRIVSLFTSGDGERKMELYNAIVKMEQGGSADGILQVRADRIQSDLEELVKDLNERCKKYGLRVKPTTLVELPFGWQPGIQEGAADWDEDWDKFEDEGFTFVKELTVDVQNVIAPPKEKSKRKEKASAVEDLPSATSVGQGEKSFTTGEQIHKGESMHNQSAKSPPGSPGRSTLESPSQDFRDNHFGKTDDTDPLFHAKESPSDDHGAAESTISGDKSFDEPTWGTFDTTDDTDSVWGFNATTKIAMKELRERKIPFTIRRYLPDGSYEDWGVIVEEASGQLTDSVLACSLILYEG